jgi:RNA polymerase sigma-70 factor (ECF subfamily)
MTDFDEIYRQHLPAVFRYAVRCVGRREVAEEITSEAFIALFRSLSDIDPALLPGWLFTVVRNRSTDYWRRAALERRYHGTLDAEPRTSVDSASIDEWLDAAPALKPVHRACLMLRYVHGLERTEIATRLGLSENQVKGHLQYAHQLLRKQLTEQK